MAILSSPKKTIDEFAWEEDFMALLGKRWALHQRKNVLEVGCGYGLWTKHYEKLLPARTTIVLSDISPTYLGEAKKRLANLTRRKFTFCVAKAQRLPFKEDSFDFITCQRLLMHVADPLEAIQELRRILHPSGILAILEPCSLYRAISNCYRQELLKNEDYGKLCYFQETAERGKINLGEGDNSIGERIPIYLQNCGFTAIKTCLNDYLVQLLPKCESDSQVFFKNEILAWFNSRFYSIWNFQEAKKYFIAGGGTLKELQFFQIFIKGLNKKVIGKIRKNNAHVVLNEPIFITWAKKL